VNPRHVPLCPRTVPYHAHLVAYLCPVSPIFAYITWPASRRPEMAVMAFGLSPPWAVVLVITSRPRLVSLFLDRLSCQPCCPTYLASPELSSMFPLEFRIVVLVLSLISTVAVDIIPISPRTYTLSSLGRLPSLPPPQSSSSSLEGRLCYPWGCH
jgi:hypothetical protein